MMAMMNTTKTIERTSTALAARCEDTQKNLGRLMTDAGCSGGACAEVTIPLLPGCRDDVVFVGLNGVSFYFMRGKRVKMPVAVREILQNTGVM